jgi:DNA mismatch repair protein MutS
MDSFTSSLYINEYELPYYHNPTTYDEIEKHISIYNPIELIIIHNIEEENIKSILNFIHHKSRKVQLISTLEENTISKQAQKCEEQCYQQELIEHFYPHLEYNHMKSYLFEHIISFQCFCFLLNYMEQHNPDLTKHLSEPHIENESKRLILANHSLKQLNILNNELSLNIDFNLL